MAMTICAGLAADYARRALAASECRPSCATSARRTPGDGQQCSGCPRGLFFSQAPVGLAWSRLHAEPADGPARRGPLREARWAVGQLETTAGPGASAGPIASASFSTDGLLLRGARCCSSRPPPRQARPTGPGRWRPGRAFAAAPRMPSAYTAVLPVDARWRLGAAHLRRRRPRHDQTSRWLDDRARRASIRAPPAAAPGSTGHWPGPGRGARLLQDHRPFFRVDPAGAGAYAFSAASSRRPMGVPACAKSDGRRGRRCSTRPVISRQRLATVVTAGAPAHGDESCTRGFQNSEGGHAWSGTAQALRLACCQAAMPFWLGGQTAGPGGAPPGAGDAEEVVRMPSCCRCWRRCSQGYGLLPRWRRRRRHSPPLRAGQHCPH